MSGLPQKTNTVGQRARTGDEVIITGSDGEPMRVRVEAKLVSGDYGATVDGKPSLIASSQIKGIVLSL